MSNDTRGIDPPFEVDIAGMSERQRFGLERQLDRRLNQCADAGDLAGLQVADEIGKIDETQIRGDIADALTQDLFTDLRMVNAKRQHRRRSSLGANGSHSVPLLEADEYFRDSPVEFDRDHLIHFNFCIEGPCESLVFDDRNAIFFSHSADR